MKVAEARATDNHELRTNNWEINERRLFKPGKTFIMTRRISIGFLFLLALSARPASATIYTWNGQGLSTAWSNVGNWVGNTNSPGQFDTAMFPSASYGNQPATDNAGDTVGVDNGIASVTIGGSGVLTITGTLVNGNAATGLELDYGGGPADDRLPDYDGPQPAVDQ